MRKRKVSVFIYANIERIKKLQAEGWTLSTIHEDMQKDFGSEFSYNTFATSLQRAKKKFSLKEKIEQNINNLSNKQNTTNHQEYPKKNLDIETKYIENQDMISKLKNEIEAENNNKDFNF